MSGDTERDEPGQRETRRLTITVPATSRRDWVSASRADGMKLEPWVVGALGAAAREQLGWLLDVVETPRTSALTSIRLS